MDNLPYAKKLKDLRKEKELTQEELAQKIGVSKSNIGRYENGTLDLSTELMVKYSEVFDVSVDYILGLTDVRKQSIEGEYVEVFHGAKVKKIDPEKIRKMLELI